MSSQVSLFSEFTATYQIGLLDPSQGIDLGGLERTGYIHPLVSTIIILGISITLFTIGFIKFKKTAV